MKVDSVSLGYPLFYDCFSFKDGSLCSNASSVMIFCQLRKRENKSVFLQLEIKEQGDMGTGELIR